MTMFRDDGPGGRPADQVAVAPHLHACLRVNIVVRARAGLQDCAPDGSALAASWSGPTRRRLPASQFLLNCIWGYPHNLFTESQTPPRPD
jgi:hypothetical protein